MFADEALVQQVLQVVIPGDVPRPADHILERVRSGRVVRDRTADGIIIVLQKFIGQDPLPVQALTETLRVGKPVFLLMAGGAGSAFGSLVTCF